LSEQYEAPIGVNKGQIISRPGTDAWKWCDVHQSERGLEIPLMTTVFLSNYDSSVYGKQNNIWKLSDGITGEVYLDVKNTPYFIYTFVKAGYYSIYNSVQDSFGNVYEISKKAFITVKDHTVKTPNDPNPEVVNSSDYGYPIPPKDRESYIYSLGLELARDQAEYIKANLVPFSSPLVIKDSSDATFNQ
jgi:PKD repeat protein